MGDIAKADAVWRQHMLKEKRSYIPTYKPLETILKCRAEVAVQAFEGENYAVRTRPMSAPPGSRRFQVGDGVCISGMNRRKDLNGVSGVLVQELPDGTGRVCVLIPASSPSMPDHPHPDAGKVMRVRADRLRARDTATASPPATPPVTPALSASRSASCPRSMRSSHERQRPRATARTTHHLRCRSCADPISPSGPSDPALGHKGFRRKATGGFYNR